MTDYETASLLVVNHGSDAIGKALAGVLEKRLLGDGPNEAKWIDVLGAVLEIQTLRPHRSLN